MWETARPVVTDYIRANLGPAAVARDLAGRGARPHPLRPAAAADGRGRADPRQPPAPAARAAPAALGLALAGALVGAALVALGTLLP